MFNSEKPSLDQLPGSAQLLRSTLFAAVAALVILVTVVLPAEYGKDYTGVGSLLGLTEMGEIKRQLHNEKLEDHIDDNNASGSNANFWASILETLVPSAHAQENWMDEVVFTLAPGASAEIKLVMKSGDFAEYSWAAVGGKINFDLHAHGGGESVTYEKGRGKESGEGSFTADFKGNHGWFWRNRDKQDVTITIRLRGDYSEVVQE